MVKAEPSGSGLRQSHGTGHCLAGGGSPRPFLLCLAGGGSLRPFLPGPAEGHFSLVLVPVLSRPSLRSSEFRLGRPQHFLISSTSTSCFFCFSFVFGYLTLVEECEV